MEKPETCRRVIKATDKAELVEVDGFKFIRKRPPGTIAVDDQDRQPNKRQVTNNTPAENVEQQQNAVSLADAKTAGPGCAGDSEENHEAYAQSGRLDENEAADGRILETPVNKHHAVLETAHGHEQDEDVPDHTPLHIKLLQSLPSNVPLIARVHVLVTQLLQKPATAPTVEPRTDTNLRNADEPDAADHEVAMPTVSPEIVAAARAKIAERFSVLLEQKVAAARAMLLASASDTSNTGCQPNEPVSLEAQPHAVTKETTVSSDQQTCELNKQQGTAGQHALPTEHNDSCKASQDVENQNPASTNGNDSHAASEHSASHTDAKSSSGSLYMTLPPMIRSAAEGPGLAAALQARLAALHEEEQVWKHLLEQATQDGSNPATAASQKANGGLQQQESTCDDTEVKGNASDRRSDDGSVGGGQASDLTVPTSQFNTVQQGTGALTEDTTQRQQGLANLDGGSSRESTRSPEPGAEEDVPASVAKTAGSACVAKTLEVVSQQAYEAMEVQVEEMEAEVSRLRRLLEQAQAAAASLQAQYDKCRLQGLPHVNSPHLLIKGITNLPGPRLGTLQAATPSHL